MKAVEINWNGEVNQYIAETDDNVTWGFYTPEEWKMALPCDWTYSEETGLLFQGKVPAGQSSFRWVN